MEQVPRPVRVTVLPETVHTDAGDALKVTGRPDEAVALTVKGGVFATWLARGPKLMVCGCPPAPLRKMICTASGALSARIIAPYATFVAVGVKTTFSVHVPPMEIWPHVF